MTFYAQLIIGPPGSGKSTYCKGMKEFLREVGREVSVVNLDPANDMLPYECDLDISELITLEDTMEKLKLGPNGSLVYCMEFLEKNIEWLHTKLRSVKSQYFLLDCPGQVELFTHHHAVKNIAMKLQEWNFKVGATYIILFFFTDYVADLIYFQLVTVHLVDAHLCSDPGKFISALLTSLSTMIQVELPHINVLSKVDLIEQYGKLGYCYNRFLNMFWSFIYSVDSFWLGLLY